jgi:hypothetical protein
MLLDTSTFTTPGSFAVGPSGSTAVPTALRVPGATILVAPQATAAAAETGLKSLRGQKSPGRRVAWFNTTELSRIPGFDLTALGRRLVQEADAALVVVCGQGAREVALGARDAGLALGRVVVCRDEATARNVLGDSIATDDAVLAFGINMDGCQRLADRLESRFSRQLAGAC